MPPRLRFIVAYVSLLLLAGCRRDESASARTLVAVSNEDSGELSLIDPTTDTIVRTIAVGKRPRGVRPSPDGKLLYIALSGSKKGGPTAAAIPIAAASERDADDDGIAVVDVEAGRVVRVLSSGRDPESFDLTPDGRKLYVSNEETSEVTVVDMKTGSALRSVKVGDEPEGVTVAPDGRTVWVTCESSNEVHVLATGSDAVIARIATGVRPRAVAFTPDGKRAFVTTENGGTVDVVDTKTYVRVASIRTGEAARPMGIALSPNGAVAFVTNGRAGSIGVIDVASGRLTRTLDGIGTRPWGIAVTPDAKKLYVATGKDTVVIDAETGAVMKRFASHGSWGVAITRGKP
jgi:YVTN family beta-propeller protein